VTEFFDTIVTGAQVEAWLQAHLQLWLPTYIAEMERQTSRAAGVLPLPRRYTTFNRFDKFPEDQLPCIVVVSPGLQDIPAKTGEGRYRARWTLGVGCVVSASTQEASEELAKVYAAAVRACVLQRPSLGGYTRGAGWLHERYDDLPTTDSRSLAAGQVIFWVEVDAVTNVNAGPTQPDPESDYLQPYGDLPVALTADVTLVKEG